MIVIRHTKYQVTDLLCRQPGDSGKCHSLVFTDVTPKKAVGVGDVKSDASGTTASKTTGLYSAANPVSQNRLNTYRITVNTTHPPR